MKYLLDNTCPSPQVTERGTFTDKYISFIFKNNVVFIQALCVGMLENKMLYGALTSRWDFRAMQAQYYLLWFLRDVKSNSASFF